MGMEYTDMSNVAIDAVKAVLKEQRSQLAYSEQTIANHTKVMEECRKRISDCEAVLAALEPPSQP